MSDKEANKLPRETYEFSRAEMQWQFGDWASLIKLQVEFQPEQLREQSKRAELALYVAAAHLQIGNSDLAKRLIDQAIQWGADRNQLSRILISGTYNSLARVAIFGREEGRAQEYFSKAISTGMPVYDEKLLVSARANHQREQVNKICIGTAPGRHANHHDSALPGLFQRLDKLVVDLYRDGTEFKLDGQPSFDGSDPFLSGKVMLGLAYHATEYSADHPVTNIRCQQLSALSEQLESQPIKSWGIYFYLKALVMLKEADVLEGCFDGDRLAKFREMLDWRGFINPKDYRLSIKAYNNMYGIGYAIALMRYRLGWESAIHADRLLELIQKLYHKYSYGSGFADETDGHGRYDRYSFLLVAEIAHYLYEIEQPLTPQLAEWLRRSCEVVLHNINTRGDGFSYGRSIGAYGDTCFIEILSAAAAHGLLSPVEIKIAYTFSCKVSRKFMGFWWDDTTNKVNLWDGGRRTNAYRGKHRALGETVSLLHQHLYVHRLWQKLGPPDEISETELREWISQRPRYLLVWFYEGEYSRAMLSIRDGDLRFNLPLVSGYEFHAQSAYLPIPYSHGIIQGIPDKKLPQLTPRVILSDGTALMPITWYKKISVETSFNGAVVTWEAPVMDDPDSEFPVKNSSCSVRTRYLFSPGCIQRVDKFFPKDGKDVSRIEMMLVLYSTGYKVEGRTITFNSGEVYELNLHGYEVENIRDVNDESYASEEGRMSTVVQVACYPSGLIDPVECSVSIRYGKGC